MPRYYGGNSMADLILRAGEARADAVARKGDIWGSTIASLPQSFADMFQRRDARDQRAAQRQMLAAQQRNLDADNARADRTEARAVRGEGRADLAALTAAETAQLDQAFKKLEITGRTLAGVTDQPGYDSALSELQQYEIDTTKFPKVYSPGTIKSAVFRVKGLAQELEAFRPKPIELNKDTVLVDPASGKELARGIESPKPVETRGLDVQAADALAKGDQATYDRLMKVKKEMGQADDRPRITVNTVADRGALVQAVIENPELYDRLTAKQIGDIAPALNVAGFKGFGKAMTDATIGKLSESKSAIASLRDLRDTLKDNEQYIGPIAGLAAMNPYSEARKAQSKIDLVKQRVGKALEGGVLRKEDEEKYKKILATLQDEPTTAIYKVDSLITTLERDMEIFVEEQRGAGRRLTQPPQAAGPNLSGLRPGAGRKFTEGPYKGQTWTIGPDGAPVQVN